MSLLTQLTLIAFRIVETSETFPGQGVAVAVETQIDFAVTITRYASVFVLEIIIVAVLALRCLVSFLAVADHLVGAGMR